MGPKTTYLLTTLGFLGIGVIMLVAVKAEAPFVLGGIGGFLKAFVIISSREGKQRELGLWTMVGITVFALIAGLIYGAFLGNPLPFHVSMGLALGVFSGTTLSWRPTAAQPTQ
ncbi:hypothetical protein A3A84_00320 [Candidatus Collierbacteria bacterium RIFCSPLOWO2_01_FULL_50_23]|nr:MAG: hypothetical protein A3A84_00320 [Candidatus Collierbacteria bacterium RIFCSPLOWO2_01_FULL_50_23]